MYYNDKIISYLQSNKILAMKFDRALKGIRHAVSEQIDTIGAGAKRALYYTSCFTVEYQDVCQQQKSEGIRFVKAIYHLLRHEDIVYEMLSIYFEEIFKYKTANQLERIKQALMAANVHIAASSLTNAGFALATATSVAMGMSLNLEISARTGRWALRGAATAAVYGIVQKAADSANRLHLTYPAYYSALYAQELEMMYFLIEPLFDRASALKSQWATENDIVDIIIRMIR